MNGENRGHVLTSHSADCKNHVQSFYKWRKPQKQQRRRTIDVMCNFKVWNRELKRREILNMSGSGKMQSNFKVSPKWPEPPLHHWRPGNKKKCSTDTTEDRKWSHASCTCMHLSVPMCIHVVVYNVMNHQQNGMSGKWQTCRGKDCSYVHVIQTIICCGLADPAKLHIFSVITRNPHV